MSEAFIDQVASPPVTELHVWIGHYAEGGEGILSGDFPMPYALGLRHMPLMNSDRAVAETFAPMARRIQSSSQHAASRITRIELRTFRAVTS
jgi:hypothetical protein